MQIAAGSEARPNLGTQPRHGDTVTDEATTLRCRRFTLRTIELIESFEPTATAQRFDE